MLVESMLAPDGVNTIFRAVLPYFFHC